MAKKNAAYGLLDRAGIKYDAPAYQQFAESLPGQLKGVDPVLTPLSNRVMELAQKRAGSSPSFDDMETIRKQAGDALASPVASERRLGAIIRDQVDNFTGSAPLTSSGGMPQAAIPKVAGHARELARRNILARDLEEMNRKSEFYVSGVESGLRNQAASYMKSSKGKTLTPAEKDAFNKLVRREGIQNLLTTAGGRLNLAVGPSIGAAAGFSAGGGPIGALIGAAASGGGHLLARKLSERSTQKALDEAIKVVLLGKKGQKALPKSRLTGNPALGRALLLGGSSQERGR
jgi:hypothetical protein